MNYSLEDLAKQVLNEYEQSGELSEKLQASLKEVAENVQANNIDKFSETLLPAFLQILRGPVLQEISKNQTRSLILEILTKIIPTANNFSNYEKTFQVLLDVMDKDNENNAVLCAKLLSDMLKSTPHKFNFDQSLRPLFSFLSKRAKSFHDRVNQIIENPMNRLLYQTSMGDRIIKSSDSIKLITEIPNLFVYACHYVEGNSEQDVQVKDILKNSLHHFIAALKDMPYIEMSKFAPKAFFSDMISTVAKLFHFITLILRQQITNEKIREHLHAQNETIMAKADDTAEALISFFKKVHEDYTTARIELLNYLRFHVKCLGKERFRAYLNDLLDDDTVFGKQKFKSIYGRNLIYQHWLETMQYLVKEMNILQVNKTFDIISKNLYDNNLYNNIQYHSLILHQKIMEEHFTGKKSPETQEGMARNIATKILQKLILKFKQIHKKILEINKYLEDKPPAPEVSEKNPVLVSNLPKKTDNLIKEEELNDWDLKKLDFIEKNNPNIDTYLFSQSWIHYKTLNIYEDEDELIANCWTIDHTTKNEYLKEIKDKIFPALLDSIRLVVDYIASPSNVTNPSMRQAAKLSEDDCYLLGKLLKYGLACMELLHNYKNPAEDRDKHMNFFIIFVGLPEKKNIRDIFETNFKAFFDIALKYAKNGNDECIQNLISPLIDSTRTYQKYAHIKLYQNAVASNWKTFAEILTRQIILKMEQAPDDLNQFHPYYEYESEYHNILQKLLKLCFRCLNRFDQDDYIEPLFKPIIMVLFKKVHTSKYSIEYILLIRNLFKNIMLFGKPETLQAKFQQLCENNLNVIKNLIALYDAGLSEMNDVLSEIILMLPLRTKQLLQISKLLIKPLVMALNLNDANFLKKGLKTIDIILSNNQNEDLEQLLSNVKEKLISKLFSFLWYSNDNEINFTTSKLLGKLGHYPRDQPIKHKINLLSASDLPIDFKIVDEEGKVEVSVSLIESIRLSIELIEQFFESKTLVTVRIGCVENAWLFLQCVIWKIIQKKIDSDDINKAIEQNKSLHVPKTGASPSYELIEDILRTLLTVASYAKLKEMEELFQNICNLFVVSYLMNPDKEDSANLVFLYALIDNIKHKIIYTRGSVNDVYYNTTLSLIKLIIDKVQKILNNPDAEIKLYDLIIERLLKVFHTKELINANGAINCLINLTDVFPRSYFNRHIVDIIESIFHVISKIPEVIQLGMMQVCNELLKKMAEYYSDMVKNDTIKLYPIIDSLVYQLLSSNENQHESAKFFIKELSKHLNMKVPLIFFEQEKGGNYAGDMSFEGEIQLHFTKEELVTKSLPISKILLLQDKIFQELTKEKIQKDQNRYLKLLRNAVETLIFLVSEKVLPYKFVDETEVNLTMEFKLINQLFEKVVDENDHIYKPYVYIISNNITNPPQRNMETEEERKEVNQPPSQNFSINKNILFDDDDFNVNIEDIDLNVKTWSKLIASLLNLMQSLMTHKTVNAVIKSRVSKKIQTQQALTVEISEIRNKIIFKFFDMMLRIEKGIRKAASKGLRTLIRLEHQAKDLLTEDKLKVILRPILICLQQEFFRFNIPFLQVLRKLVKYLSQCFNKTLSDKLLEHLGKFMELLASGSRRPNEIVDDRKISSGLFYLFEHLPHASTYVDVLIKMNTKIDTLITTHSGLTSLNYLMRKPLLRIVNCFASGSVELFLLNMNENWKIFFYILKSECSHPIRERLARETQSFMERNFNADHMVNKILTSNLKVDSYKAIRIIKIISKKIPSWILKPNVIQPLIKYWRSKDLKRALDDDFCKEYIRDETTQLLKIFVLYCKQNRSEINIIFDILQVFNFRNSNDFAFLHNFYRYFIPENYTAEEKKNIFVHFLAFIKNDRVPIETKANASYILIYPMMLKCFKSGEARKMFPDEVINQVCELVNDLIKKRYSDHGRLEIEILQICGLIISYLRDEYMNEEGHEKERKINLLKFGWFLMKNEDKVYANIAKLFICKFTAKNGLPFDQIMQIYVSLLKGQEYINSHDNDIKLLSRKALDILIPYLPSIRSNENIGENPNQPPKWISWTCKVFNEENWTDFQGYSFARFWQVFIRMHKIFSKYKTFFFTQMINSMQYLVLPMQQNSMYKKIAIDLALIYIEWQYQDIKEKLDKESEIDKKLTIINQHLVEQSRDIREIFVSFFIKLAINSCQEKEEKENITRKALFLLKKWLIISPGAPIKYSAVEKFLNALQSSYQQGIFRDQLDKNKSCLTVLMIISTLIEFDKVQNVKDNIETIYKLLTHQISNCFLCDNPYIIQMISNLTRKLLLLKVPGFQKKIFDLVENGIKSYIQAKSRAQPDAMKALNITIYTTIRISKVILEIEPEALDNSYSDFLDISKNFIDLFKKNVYGAPPGLTKKSIDDDEDLLANIDDQYSEEGFEHHKFNFSNLREFLIILLRILSLKLSSHTNNQGQTQSQEKKSMIELLDSIMEKLSDVELTMEVLSILNSLLLADYTTDFKSHLPPIKGCFTTKEKIIYFLDPTKVSSILERHSHMRHHDGERVMKKYSKLMIDLLKYIPLSEMEIERLRKLIVTLNKYVPMAMSNQLFEIVDSHFGTLFTKKLMFFLLEYSDENHISETENDEDLVPTLVNYLIFHVNKEYKIAESLTDLPLFNKGTNSITGGLDIENDALKSSIKTLNDFMTQIETHNTQKLFLRLRKLMTVEYPTKKEMLKFYLKELIAIVWKKSSRTEKQFIVQTFENYLYNRTCTVTASAILYAIENLYPSFKLKPEVVQFIAKKNNTWNISLYILEKYTENEEDEDFENTLLTLVELYTRLGEKDMLYGLKRLMCEEGFLKNGLTMSQHRLWVKAGKSFSKYIETTVYEPANILDILNKKLAEENWINIHKELNDWGSIGTIIKNVETPELHVEYAWQTKERKFLEKFVSLTDNMPSTGYLVSSLLGLISFAENTRLDEAQLASSFKKIEESITYSIFYSVQEWNYLPKLITNAHKHILIRLQSLVEIDEASTMVSKIKERENPDVPKEHFANQLVAHMDIWKSRMPAKYEDLTVWKTILDQRNFLYSYIKKRLEIVVTSNPQTQTSSSGEGGISEVDKKINYFSDVIWNNLKYANIERKFDHFGQVRGGPPQFWKEGPSNPGEMYLSLKEQVMYRLNCHFDYDNAMKIANNAISNDMLTIEHKSEMHRLKHLIHSQMGKIEDANNECIEALKICDTNWKCWHTWAVSCFKNFLSSKNLKWAEQTIICFNNGVKYKPHKTRLLLADIFWMLTQDDRNKTIKNAFDKLADDMPVWIWILWIPQLLAAVIKNRFEAQASFNILKKIAKEYPQSMYFYLKKFKQNSSNNGYENFSAYFGDLLETLKTHQPILHDSLEYFTDFTVNINVNQEEKMINEMNSLISSLFLLDSLAQMDRFRLKIFLLLQSFESQIRGIPFNEIIKMQSANLIEILGILKNLSKSSKERVAANKIHKIDPHKLLKLQALMSKLVEIPGQYQGKNEPMPQNHHKVVEVCKEVESEEKSRNIMRILSLKATNGKVYQYLINNRVGNSNQEILLPFLNSQLKQIMNVKLSEYRETAMRHLKLKITGEYFVNSQVSLIEYKSRSKSINDLMDEHLLAKGVDYDHALELYLKENTLGNAQAKMEIFKKMESLVPNNLIKKFALRCVNNMDEYFWFRNNFISTFGMENFFSYLISNEIMLDNMYIDPSKGNFFYMGMRPTFNESSQIVKENPNVSIRISKNFENFITNMGLEGPFASCFISSSLAFSNWDSDLTTVFFIYNRDCLLKIDHEEVSKKELMENAEVLRDRLIQLSYENNDYEYISERIYKIIEDLTTQSTRIAMPKKFKYWF